MRKVYLIFGSVLFWQWMARAQSPDSTVRQIPRTTIDLVYNNYFQDGNHSAVTGGIGTEKLIVYAPSFNIRHTAGRSDLNVNGGVDIITSASTDRIDFLRSSASWRDQRGHADIGYSHAITKGGLSANAGAGFSIESDYLSFNGKLGLQHNDKAKAEQWSVQFIMYYDDLRWGRLNKRYQRPVRLIYPTELRYRDWYSDYLRRSYNLRLGWNRALNRRTVLGADAELVYQNGLLATPFHRVYFTDGDLRPENLPYQRWKGSLALRLNRFVGGMVIVRNAITGYVDNFGIMSISVENETALKLRHDFSLTPGARWYVQTASPFFAPYAQQDPSKAFYTSDYDLSALQTITASLGLRYAPYRQVGRSGHFNSILIRYAYMYRTDGMQAHTIGLVIQMDVEKRNK
jgi:hypothetical protein